MERKIYDICIIGGGAAGLACAAELLKLKPGAKVFIVEKNDVLGRKILSTGNGRCNLSNKACPGHEEILRFFDGIGVITRSDETGRIYPYSEDARDVADALTDTVIGRGAEVVTGAACTACSFDEKEMLYEVQAEVKSRHSEDKKAADRVFSIYAKRVLISTGGKAAPKLGTTGDGYRLAKKFYHTVTKLAPALTAIETHEDVSALSGVRSKVRLSLIVHGGTIFEEDGEVQFTDYGISGICAFDMSRFMEIPEGRTLINGFDDYAIEIDFLPDARDARALVEKRLADAGESEQDDRAAGASSNVGAAGDGSDAGMADAGSDVSTDAGMARVLRSVVKRPVAEMIMEKTGGEPEMTAWLLKHFMLHPSGLRGWGHAQITKGGVPLSEIKTDRMESKYFPGLFFAGEIVDFDGPCGGFNLEHAWESGIRAAHAVCEDMDGEG